ncbi:BZ3500_MvSof-1268-A1-R1_Chr5-2g08015 [Microbotryum saponariae]|uniref:BZ3500_MvSof-1268-A1-R1_Chr5-2g08015 protein n=1 Tax=Microbotryum saponariae TaxID=289078 RepID=A0A2X0LFU5_9BASI|nr:BZ3500_MvSof-1268-A1-R1_Chr5-2g08015 [Microbotryum saponariae]SDA05884.1 BZ3501_MvSof-1269-A2-R1_Chr5-2g07837 [Microbotryum saponariae]
MASSSSSKRPATTPEEWNNRLAAVDVSKDDLNSIISDYLFTEGYLDAATHFSREANISPPIDLDSIESRMEIRRAVQRGDVREATELVNNLDPELLDTNPALHFHLLQLQLIELIRQGEIEEALTFAQSELAPRGEESPQFLKELERTMALLAFEMPSLLAATEPSTNSAPAASAPRASSGGAGKKSRKSGAGGEGSGLTTEDTSIAMPSSISSLLDQSQRLETASELNAAILTSQSHSKDPKLPGLMKMLVWGETLLNERNVDYPKWSFHDLLREQGEGAEGRDADAMDL